MGGAWAYEALSFGGFWAWDPVENASLVPWLLLVGCIHLMAINLKKASHVFSLLFFALSSYVFVVYSTFLTKSGVLGDSSVHSFTDNGMSGQLMFFLGLVISTMIFSLLIDKTKRLLFLGFLIVVLGLLTVVPQAGAVMLFFIIGLGLFLVLSRQNVVFKNKEEEKFLAREFWMFAGALVLFLSAMQISFSTSTPVYNILLEPFAAIFNDLYEATNWAAFKSLAKASFAPPAEPIAHYNKWQVPFAIIVSLLVAVTQYFKYKNTPAKQVAKDLWLPLLLSVLLTAGLAYYYDFSASSPSLILLLFSSSFAVIANLYFLFKKLSWNWSKGGASLSHIGFGLIILGSLIATGKSEEISENTSGIDLAALGEDFKNNEDILLFKGDTLSMNNYFIHYKDRAKEGVNIYYEVEYFSLKDNHYSVGDLALSQGLVFRCIQSHRPTYFISDRELYWEYVSTPTPSQWSTAKNWNAHKPGEKQFSLFPRIQLNPRFGNVAEPATKHYVGRDVYTHVRWAELEEPEVDELGYYPATEHKIKKGDTVYTSQNMVILKNLRIVKDYEKYALLSNDLAIAAELEITGVNDSIYFAEPLFILRDSSLVVPDVADVEELGLKITFNQVDPEKGNVSLNIAEHQSNRKEFIVMRAIIFPAINILWLGCIVMAIGIFSSVYSYRRKKKTAKGAGNSKGGKA